MNSALLAAVANTYRRINFYNLLSGLVAYWKLDNSSWLDSTGNGHTLTNHNGVTNGTGIINGDAVFASSSSRYLSVNSLGTISGDFSVSIWFKSAGKVVSYPTIFANDQYFALYIQDIIAGANGIRIGLASGNITLNGNYIQNNVWYNLVVVRQSNTIKVYLNGTFIGTGTDTSTYGFTTTCLGAAPWDLAETYFNGEIDEVGIWNRALSQAEAAELYSLGKMQISYPFNGDKTPSICLDPNATNCLCNAGYVWNGVQCMYEPICFDPNATNCLCNAGYVWNGVQCMYDPICSDPNATNCLCNAGYVWNGVQCMYVYVPPPTST